MAADTRPYKSKEQDGQGNEVIIRDQQLVEQSTVTTMPSGACFETLDIDGRPVKIPRDNMMSIVLECIGIVLNDSSKNLGTNVNKALGLQGNTIGNVTVNDFASVLGVKSRGMLTDILQNTGDRFMVGMVQPSTFHSPISNGYGIAVRFMASNNNDQTSTYHYTVFVADVTNNKLYLGYYWEGITEDITWKQVSIS
jgi:hypothetical protein